MGSTFGVSKSEPLLRVLPLRRRAVSGVSDLPLGAGLFPSALDGRVAEVGEAFLLRVSMSKEGQLPIQTTVATRAGDWA